MDDIDKNLSYLIPLYEQNIWDKFDELKKVLAATKADIFQRLWTNQEKFKTDNLELTNSICGLIKPYHILRQGRAFISFLEKSILDTQEQKQSVMHHKFHDSYNLIEWVLDDYDRIFVWENTYTYRAPRRHIRLDMIYKWEENKAYKAVSDAIRKFLVEKQKEGVEIAIIKGTFAHQWFCETMIRIKFNKKK
jgi:hypothetical protein